MKLSDAILRHLTVRVDEEMRHGQKIARRVKARPARAVPASPEVVTVHEPVVAPAPDTAAPEAPVQPES